MSVMTEMAEAADGSRGRSVRRFGFSSPRARRETVLMTLVGIGVLAAYLALERGQIDSWDGKAMASVAQNLLQHHSLKECCRAYGAFPRDKGPYAKFGIGFTALLVPLWHFQLVSHPGGATWLGLANPLLLAATAVIIVKTGLVLGWRGSSAALTGLAFAFLTMAPLYSTTFFAEPGVTFGSALLVLGFVLWERRARAGALVIGVAIATSILFRPDSIILIAPLVVFMVLFRSRDFLVRTWRSWIAWLAIPIGLALGWTFFYDSLRYGSPFQVGYSGAYDSRGFSSPLRHGAVLLLFSPGKSFFVYSPILIAAIPGMVLLVRRRLPLAVVIGVMFALRVAFYSRWWTPEGGNSWGPRFLLPLCAVLAIPLGEAIDHVHDLPDRARRAVITGFGVLVGASILVEISSLLVSYRDIFTGIYNLSALPASIQHIVFHQRLHSYFWTIGGNHIAWNLGHIGSKKVEMPLYWFHDGATLFGVAMLALAALACSSAIALASRSDRIEQHQAGR
jgi:hypothetical protein